MIYSLRPNIDYIFVSYVSRIHQWEAREKNKTKQNKNEILIEERKTQRLLSLQERILSINFIQKNFEKFNQTFQGQGGMLILLAITNSIQSVKGEALKRVHINIPGL